MLDASTAYDTYIVDDPDEPAPLPSLPRVPTEELTMQVNVLGRWHRRTPDLATTACGVPFHSQFAAVRREELCHPICRECFTQHELRLADQRQAKENP